MEAVIFVGIQASGKSTFYRERFSATHVRISLDLLRTRHRERSLLAWCLDHQQPFVVDNTNPTRAERAVYIAPAQTAGFRVTGYYFESNVPASIRRNEGRLGVARVPPAAIGGALHVVLCRFSYGAANVGRKNAEMLCHDKKPPALEHE